MVVKHWLYGAWLAGWLAVVPCAAGEESLFLAGVARVDITPDYPVRLNGFGGRREESEGVTQRIWAKALAVQHREQSAPLVLLSIDSLGVRRTMVEEAARRLGQSHGVPRENIALVFSHSHTTPKVNGASDTIFSTPIPEDHQRHIDRYTEQLTDWLEEAAAAALRDMKPARLEWTAGEVGFARNRRTPGGPVDHRLPVLFVRSESGEVRAVYATYACHCVTLSHNKISGDWAGYAQEWIERKFPGAIGLVSIGCGSDANPDSGVAGDRVDLASAQGAQIADEVARLSRLPRRSLSEPPRAELRLVDLRLEPPPTEQQLRETAAAGGPAGYNAQFQLDRLHRGETLPEVVPYPIQTWRFGEQAAWVFLAGEVCVDYALRIRREFDGERLWLHGYANDFSAYIPSERLLREGGYGGGGEIPYFALPNKFAPGLEQQIMDEVRRQLPPSYQRQDGDVGPGAPPPRSPEQSAALMRLAPEFTVEIVASEPQIRDPVAIDFAADGSLWVVEMSDYGRAVEGEFAPSGAVKRLYDDDGDGRYERSETFAEGFRFPTDVKVWRDGLLVCDAPAIVFLQDRDGDGRADLRESWYDGFATHNPHARVNSLSWGLDGWLYGSGGLFGGLVHSDGKQTDVRDQDFRLLPDQRRVEPAAGRTQQGRARDDWGNWYGCNNSQLVLHYPLRESWLNSSPHLRPPATVVSIESSPDANQLFPRGELVRFKLSGPAGRATSACGLTVYRDDWLGASFANNVFVCEPVNQLVHRQVLQRDGGLVRALRAADETEREFLTSTDQWFRPVQAKTGLDGGLWIVDMYRYVIEHPQWIPEETKSQLNVMAGSDRGRIYRVAPRGAGRRPPLRMDRLKEEELADVIASPNGPRRDLAHQMLSWGGHRESAPRLRSILRDLDAPPAARVQALAALATLASVQDADLEAALRDPSDEVRFSALCLPRDWAASGLNEARLEMLRDKSPQVRMAAAWTLAASPDPRAAAALLAALRQDQGDAYLRFALQAAADPPTAQGILREAAGEAGLLAADWMQPVFQAACRGGDAERLDMLRWLAAETPEASRANEEQTLADLAWRWRALREWLATHDEQGDAWTEPLRQGAAALRLRAAEHVVSADQVSDATWAAVSLLGEPNGAADLGGLEAARDALLGVLAADRSAELQQEAVRGLARLNAPETAEHIVHRLDQTTPAVRAMLLDALLDRPAWTAKAADHFLQNQTAWRALDAARRVRLLRSVDSAAAARLGAAATGEDNSDAGFAEYVRQAVAAVQEAPAETNAANASWLEQGKSLFLKHCANCHRVGETGSAVGPDLSAVTVRRTEWWLTSILLPNREFDQRYGEYQVTLKDGRVLSGLLVEESGTALVLAGLDGSKRSLLRSEIESLRNMGRSFMPEGFARLMAPAEMASLLSFLLQDAPAPKSAPGNAPRVVSAEADGGFVLEASAAEIYGGDITFEATHRNIGYWHGERDLVRWRVHAEHPGEYAVFAVWSCADASAGNRYRVEGLEPTLRGVVEGTGSWSNFRRSEIGRAVLDGGEHSLWIVPEGPPQGALWDLQRLELRPLR